MIDRTLLYNGARHDEESPSISQLILVDSAEARSLRLVVAVTLRVPVTILVVVKPLLIALATCTAELGAASVANVVTSRSLTGALTIWLPILTEAAALLMMLIVAKAVLAATRVVVVV